MASGAVLEQGMNKSMTVGKVARWNNSNTTVLCTLRTKIRGLKPGIVRAEQDALLLFLAQPSISFGGFGLTNSIIGTRVAGTYLPSTVPAPIPSELSSSHRYSLWPSLRRKLLRLKRQQLTSASSDLLAINSVCFLHLYTFSCSTSSSCSALVALIPSSNTRKFT